MDDQDRRGRLNDLSTNYWKCTKIMNGNDQWIKYQGLWECMKIHGEYPLSQYQIYPLS